MFKNYLKAALRTMLRNKGITLIHVLGLSIGLAAFLLIDQYITFEKSYDAFHPEAERIYRLTTDNIIDGKIQVRDAMSFAPSGEALMNDLPEVESYTTTRKIPSAIFRRGSEVVEESGLLAVDSSFLHFFNYPVLRGEQQDLLAEPYTMVLTRTMADRYFPDSDPIGQEIELLGNINQSFRVVGLVADVPENTHYKFEALISLRSLWEQVQRDAWSGYNYYTYLLLDPQADLNKLKAQLPALTRKYLSPESKLVFHLQPIRDIHLHSDFTFEPEVHGSAKAVGFLSIISLFILIIAWVNYTNLSTARAMVRAKEVGLRKVVGARKQQLLVQFFSESLVINSLGALAALIILQVTLPYFNDLVGKTVLTSIWSPPTLLLKLLAFCLLGTLLAGAYPALMLSSFRPIGVLRGSFNRSGSGMWMRKSLVVLQFAASLILIAGTIVIYQQVRFMMGKDLGVDIEQTVGLQNPSVPEADRAAYESRFEAFARELERRDGILGLATMESMPGGGSADISSSAGGIGIAGITEPLSATIYINEIDDRAIDLLDMELLAGRGFDREIAEDTNAVIVNRAFLRQVNIADPASIINEHIQFGSDPDSPQYPIIGVLSDFNRTTLKNNVEATLFFYERVARNTVVKLDERQLQTGLAQLEQTWQGFFPTTPLSYHFLDERFERLYVEEKRFGQLFATFSILAIIVAGLGLLGLSAFLSNQRTKEVGVRKVLGASVGNIVLLFFRDYLWLILLALLIGMPLIFLGMNQWLSNYSYRIDFPWWTLLVSALLLMAFAFITVGYQTYKVAILNPARTIRDE